MVCTVSALNIGGTKYWRGLRDRKKCSCTNIGGTKLAAGHAPPKMLICIIGGSGSNGAMHIRYFYSIFQGRFGTPYRLTHAKCCAIAN